MRISFLESVSKFFRVGSSSQAQHSPAGSLPKNIEDELLNQTDATISELSDTSALSLNSSAFDLLNKTDDTIPEIEILNEQEIATIRLETDDCNHEKVDETDDTDHTIEMPSTDMQVREIQIGSIANQPLIYYTVRLIASKFLLIGVPYKLIDDINVRVSIKNLSLAVLGHCVTLCPRILLLSLQYNGPDNVDLENNSDSDDSGCSNSQEASNVAKPNSEQADQLVIKDDHFGENNEVPKTYFDFFFPLSKSADNVLLSRLNTNISGGDSVNRIQKLNGDLSDLLSKSEIIESKSAFNCLDFAADSKSDTAVSNQALIQLITEGNLQFVEDVLLFWDHGDPVLRANIQLMVGNFLFNVLNECELITNFIERLEIVSTYRFLNFNVLFHILLKVKVDFQEFTKYLIYCLIS